VLFWTFKNSCEDLVITGFAIAVILSKDVKAQVGVAVVFFFRAYITVIVGWIGLSE